MIEKSMDLSDLEFYPEEKITDNMYVDSKLEIGENMWLDLPNLSIAEFYGIAHSMKDGEYDKCVKWLKRGKLKIDESYISLGSMEESFSMFQQSRLLTCSIKILNLMFEGTKKNG